MSIKNSIGWTEMTLNPIKGRCKGGCWYCYYSGKRGMLNRFKLDSKILLDLKIFNKLPKKPKRIFLCSIHDLFGDWIPKTWRDYIFHRIKDYPQHTFQILTKFPENIDRPMSDNVWLGVTSTGYPYQNIFTDLGKSKAKIKFISFEPLLTAILLDNWFWNYNFDWIIVGRLTGYGHKYDPKRIWIEKIIEKAKKYSIPIFMKDNLKEIWGENLIQEWPQEGK